MIGKKIIFKANYYQSDTNSGEVLDKIVESDSERDDSYSIHGQDLVLTSSYTYYLVADEQGYVHRVKPKMIVRVVV